MAFYRVLRTITDLDKAVFVTATQVIECNNQEWVNRMGPKMLHPIPASKAEGLKVVKIWLPDDSKVEVEKSESTDQEQQKMIEKAPIAKIVTGGKNK